MYRYIVITGVLLSGIFVYIFSPVFMPATLVRKTIPKSTAVYKKDDLSNPIFMIEPGDTCFFREESKSTYNNQEFNLVKVDCGNNAKGWIIGSKDAFPDAQ